MGSSCDNFPLLLLYINQVFKYTLQCKHNFTAKANKHRIHNHQLFLFLIVGLFFNVQSEF